MDENTLNLITTAIESGRCLVFLGAGASAAYTNKQGEEVQGLPTGGTLSEELAKRCAYKNGSVYDLLRVAEYFVYTQSGDRTKLHKIIRDNIQVACPPRPIHTVLAQLTQIKFVITSNYDTLIETEMTQRGRQIRRHVHDPNNPRSAHLKVPLAGLGEKEVILHKMHGTIEEPETIIVTQSDYIRYLTTLNDRDRGMPEYFRRQVLPQVTLLFLGYSLEDWNFRVIWEGLVSSRAPQTKQQSYALLKDPSHFQSTYWSSRNIVVLNQDITDFAERLALKFNLDVPQLGIERRQNGAHQQQDETS